MVNHYPTCLTIAGSDSSGGAGIQADLKTMSALGVYGMSVITAVTAQNTCGVTGIQAISPHIVKAQLEAVLSDIVCDAVKIGMLFSSHHIRALIDILDKYSPRFTILDPVLVSTSGHRLYDEDDMVPTMKELLFPRGRPSLRPIPTRPPSSRAYPSTTRPICIAPERLSSKPVAKPYSSKADTFANKTCATYCSQQTIHRKNSLRKK